MSDYLTLCNSVDSKFVKLVKTKENRDRNCLKFERFFNRVVNCLQFERFINRDRNCLKFERFSIEFEIV